MNGRIGLRIFAALVLIAAVAGVAFFAFQAGVAQGSPITVQSPSGETAPLPYPYYGYGMPFHRPFGFGYGFGCFGPLLGFFLIFLAFRLVFWGSRWGWGHRGGLPSGADGGSTQRVGRPGLPPVRPYWAPLAGAGARVRS